MLQLLVFEEVYVPTKDPTVEIDKLTLDGRRVKGAFAATTHAYECPTKRLAWWSLPGATHDMPRHNLAGRRSSHGGG